MEKKKVTPDSNSLAGSGVLRSLTRLVVGGISLGFDGLIDHLNAWEQQVAETNPIQLDQATQSQNSEGVTTEIITIPEEEVSSADSVRFALIGMAFGIEERLLAGFETLDRFTRAINNLADPIISPISDSELLSPLRRRYDDLVSRGQEEVNRWIDIGRAEDYRSQAIARVAFGERVDNVVGYLSDNEEIHGLIESQSVGLAGEIAEEIRERSLSADNFLEGTFRSILKRLPRSDLPEPPPEVKSEAAPYIKIKGRIIRK